MTPALRATLEHALDAGLARGHGDVVLFALHIGCGAIAMGLSGRITPVVRHDAERSAVTCARVEDLGPVVNGDVL